MPRSWLCTTRSRATLCSPSPPLELFCLCLLPRWLFIPLLASYCSSQVVQSVRDNLTNRLTGKKETQETLRMLPDFAEQNKLLFFAPRYPTHQMPSNPVQLQHSRGRTVQLLNVAEASITKLELPFSVSSVHPLSESQYLLVRFFNTSCPIFLAIIQPFREMEEGAEQEPRLYALKRPEGCEDPLPSVLHPITATTEEVLQLDNHHLIIHCRLT